jgi:hypothetical protein
VGANVFDRNPPYYTTKAKESRDVLLFRDCKDCVVQGVLLNGIAAKEGAIQLERCTGMNVQGCSILEHGEIGLSLRDCRDCWITGCMFRGNGEAGASAIKESGISEGNDLSNNRSGGIVAKAK